MEPHSVEQLDEAPPVRLEPLDEQGIALPCLGATAGVLEILAASDLVAEAGGAVLLHLDLQHPVHGLDGVDVVLGARRLGGLAPEGLQLVARFRDEDAGLHREGGRGDPGRPPPLPEREASVARPRPSRGGRREAP